MGRAFEYRKERKMKRWANMAKTFTRIGREIAIAVKEGGADPEYNPRLRLAIQNAKTANMPKANVENAIKKATSKASVRHIFSKYGGNLSTSGSVDYMFSRKANFKVKAEGQDGEELELGLIDFGLEELRKEDDKIVLVCAFEDYGNLQKGIEEFGLEVTESELIRIPSHYKELTDSEVEDVIKLIEIMEDDDDVNAVFHNMKED